MFKQLRYISIACFTLTALSAPFAVNAQQKGISQIGIDGENFTDVACVDFYRLKPSYVQVQDSKWWFEPYEKENKKFGHFWPVKTLDGDLSLGADINTAVVEFDYVPYQSYLSRTEERLLDREKFFVIRESPIFVNHVGRPLGRFYYLIAKADIDHNVIGNRVNLKQKVVLPLALNEAQSEVVKGDWILPKSCLKKMNGLQNVKKPNEPENFLTTDTNATVIGLMDQRMLANQSHIAIMDAGSRKGVKRGQIWAITQTLSERRSNKDDLRRIRGLAKVMQVFDDYSVIVIESSSIEVTLGVELRPTPKLINVDTGNVIDGEIESGTGDADSKAPEKTMQKTPAVSEKPPATSDKPANSGVAPITDILPEL